MNLTASLNVSNNVSNVYTLFIPFQGNVLQVQPSIYKLTENIKTDNFFEWSRPNKLFIVVNFFDIPYFIYIQKKTIFGKKKWYKLTWTEYNNMIIINGAFYNKIQKRLENYLPTFVLETKSMEKNTIITVSENGVSETYEIIL